MKLPPGLYMVTRPKLAGAISHYGILMVRRDGRTRVFQLDERGCGIVPLREYAAGDRVTVLKKIPPADVSAALGRMARLVKERPRYNFAVRNCEHAARWVAEGREESGQAWRGTALGIVLIGFGLMKGL